MLSVKIAIPKIAWIAKQKRKQLEGAVIEAANEVAEDGARFAQMYILTHTKRHPSSGKLAKAMQKGIKVDGRTYNIGIGDVSKLPEYWYVVNYGKLFGGASYVPPATPGYFSGSVVPIKGGSGERFVENKNTFFIRPGKPVEPMYYIQATRAYLSSKWQSRVTKGIRPRNTYY